MCTVLLPSGDNPISVNKDINNEQRAMQQFQVKFLLYSGICDKNFWPDAR